MLELRRFARKHLKPKTLYTLITGVNRPTSVFLVTFSILIIFFYVKLYKSLDDFHTIQDSIIREEFSIQRNLGSAVSFQYDSTFIERFNKSLK